MALTILVAGGAPLSAAPLTRALRDAGHDVVEVADGPGLLNAVERSPFDAIVLGHAPPAFDGVALVGRLRSAGLTLPVLMLSARGMVRDRIEGLDAGADDYVVHPASPAEIAARLAALVRGRGWTDRRADTVRAGDITVSPGRRRAWYGDCPLDLARLEFALLAELVRDKNAVLSRDQLLERAWPPHARPVSNSVEVYIRRLRAKLAAVGGGDPIVTIRGVGYMLRG